ncbi:MAG: tetratricopeptide repeat protein [Bryobacteraceae bacterium]
MAKSKARRRKKKTGLRLAPPPPRLPVIEPDTEDWELVESQLAVALPVERIMSLVTFGLAHREVQSPEEAQDLLASFSEEKFERLVAEVRAAGPRRHAQDLAYEAMIEANDEKEATGLATRALGLDPDCLDAMAVLAECGSGSPEQLLAELERIADKGRRLFPPERFAQVRDEVWEELELRPFLRALFRLGDAYRTLQRPEEGIAVLEELMALNPADQQRAREPLLSCCLAAGRLERARELLARFPEDDSAVFHWGRVLERFLGGDEHGAVRALRNAEAQNPHAAAYMTMSRKPPSQLPETYEPGGKDEAVHCLYMAGTAWAAHPDAILWARDVRQGGPG